MYIFTLDRDSTTIREERGITYFINWRVGDPSTFQLLRGDPITKKVVYCKLKPPKDIPSYNPDSKIAHFIVKVVTTKVGRGTSDTFSACVVLADPTTGMMYIYTLSLPRGTGRNSHTYAGRKPCLHWDGTTGFTPDRTRYPHYRAISNLQPNRTPLSLLPRTSKEAVYSPVDLPNGEPWRGAYPL